MDNARDCFAVDPVGDSLGRGSTVASEASERMAAKPLVKGWPADVADGDLDWMLVDVGSQAKPTCEMKAVRSCYFFFFFFFFFFFRFDFFFLASAGS